MMAEPWRWRHMMAEVWYGIPKDTTRQMMAVAVAADINRRMSGGRNGNERSYVVIRKVCYLNTLGKMLVFLKFKV